MGTVATLLLVLASFAAAATPPYRCFPYSAQGNATIEPTRDIITEVGDSFEAYCLFDSNYINVSDVSLGYRISGDNFYKLPHEVVNSSAIRVNVETDRPMEHNLWCARNEKYHLCSRTLKVGYLPQNVQNFTCLSKNWSSLNCTWTIPYNPVKVVYTVTYVIPGFRNQSECPRKNHDETSCFWPKNIFDLNVKDEMVLHFNATNKLKEDGVEFTYTVNIPESVIPDPVNKLTAIVDGPHNVTLTWVLPYPIDTFSRVLCEAAYRQRLDGDVSEEVPWTLVETWKVEPDRWSPGETFNRTINNLLPYIQYDFRVRIHTGFGKERPNMWSDAAILTMRTTPSNPTVAPKTTNGTFEVEETLSYRDIYILWQIVDPLHYNGPNFHYNISAYDDKSNRLIAKDSAEVDIKESYAKFSNMEKDITYRFEIVPVNDEGPPQDVNVRGIVMVPGKSELLKQPTFFKVIAYSEANKTVYSLKWRVDETESQRVETVTLYWCKKIKYEERCQNKLEWEIIDDPNLNVKNLTNLEDSALYMFGISMNTAQSSSGIKWITCIASFGNHPPPLEHFAASAVRSTEVHLEWSLDCKAKAAEPIGFNISYCAVVGDSQKCPVDAEKSYIPINEETALEYVVRDLHPYTKYIFNIAILTQIGLSKWSKSVLVETKPDKPTSPPEDFKTIETDQSWIRLSWKPPNASERNGKITLYKLSWESTYGPKEETVSASSSSEITEYNVTDLDPFTKYSFKVIACTEMEHSDVSCGNNYSETVIKTKIGAPSKVDDISQVDDYVKWEHECTNGPKCFYQLLYTVNSTEHIHETEANAASINIRELNITCTKEEKDITIKLRAVTYNESEQKLFGPWKEESVTCYLTGSYSPDHVPNTSEKLQIILVHLPQNNQYNTVINIFKNPITSSSLLPHMHSNKVFKIPGDERGRNTWRVLMGSSKSESDDRNLNVKDKVNYGESYGGRHTVSKNVHNMNATRVSNNETKGAIADGGIGYLSKQEKESAYDHDIEVGSFVKNVEFSKQNVEMRDISLLPKSTYIQPKHNEYPKPYIYPYPNQISHKLSCPLLNLMTSPGSEVRINASDTKFEFSLKGAGNPYSILKALYQHSSQLRKPNRDFSDFEEVLPLDGSMFSSHQSVSGRDIMTVKRDERNTMPSRSMPLGISKMQVILQEGRDLEQLELNESQPLFEKDNVSGPSISKEKTVMANDILELDIRRDPGAKEVFDLQLFNIENATRKDLDNRSLPLLANESAIIFAEIPKEDNIGIVEILNSSHPHKEIPSVREVGVTSNGSLLSIFNGNLKMQLQEDGPEKESSVTWPTDQPSPYSSLIYRIIGSFNGNVQGTSHKDKQLRELFPLVSSLGNDRDQFYKSQSQYDSRLTSEDYQKRSTVENSYSVAQPEPEINQAEHNNMNPSCPFADLIKSKGVNVQLISSGDGEIEFSFKGNGNFFDLLETLYDVSESKSQAIKRLNGNIEDPVMERIHEINIDEITPQAVSQTPVDGKELNQRNFEALPFVEITTEHSLEGHSQGAFTDSSLTTDFKVAVTLGGGHLTASQLISSSDVITETSIDQSTGTEHK